MKIRLLKLYNNEYFPFLVLGIGFLLLSLLVPIPTGDDKFFQTVPNGIFDWSFYLNRYETWTSRVIIDLLIVTFLHIPSIIWRIANALIIVFLGVATSKLFITETNRRYKNWFLVTLIFIFPFKELTDTGWIATSINYLWPFSLSLYPLLILQKTIQSKPIKIWEYTLAIILLLIAANQEVICALLVIIFFIATIYSIIKKLPKGFIIICLFLLVMSLVFILTTPGNFVRNISELKWFWDFNHISFIEKIEIGLSSTLAYQVYRFNFIFLLLALSHIFIINRKYKDTFYRLLSFFPLVVNMVFNYTFHFSDRLFPSLPQFYWHLTKYGYVTLNNFTSINSYIPLIVLYLTSFIVVILLYLTFENTTMSLIALFSLGLGFLSRMAIALSPTIWGSGTRTHTFFTYTILICILLVFQKIDESEPVSYSQNLLIITGLVSSLTYINLLMTM